MAEVKPAAVVKYKVRRVSAVRDFPPGCGPNASFPLLLPLPVPVRVPESTAGRDVCPPPSAVGEIAGSSHPQVLENGDRKQAEVPELHKQFVQLPELVPAEVACSLPPMIPENGALTLLEAEGSSQTHKVSEKYSDSAEIPLKDQVTGNSDSSAPRPAGKDQGTENSDSSATRQAGETRIYSKVYPPHKMRKIPVIRDFPAGCGPSSLYGSGRDRPIVAPDASSESRTQEQGKALTRQTPVPEGSVNGGVVEVVVTDEVVSSAALRVKEERDINEIPVVRSPIKDKSGEKKSNELIVIPSSEESGAASMKFDAMDTSSKEKNLMSRSDSGKNEAVLLKVPLKTCSSEVIPTENREKKILYGSSSGKLRVPAVKSIPNSNSSEFILKKEREEKVMSKPDSIRIAENTKNKIVIRIKDKTRLVGNESNSGSKSNLAPKSEKKAFFSGKKIESHTDIHSPEMKPYDADEKIKANKHLNSTMDKGSIKRVKDSAIHKRKFSGDSESNSMALVVRNEQESIEDYGDRLIVQALMSAENSPWGQGKKWRETGAPSIASKKKVKREPKLPKREFSPGVPSVSLHKKKDKVEDEDEDEDDAPQEVSDKARNVYRSLCEVNVNLTPIGPSKPKQSGEYSDDRVTRNKVKRALRLFQVMCRKLLQQDEDKSKKGGRTSRVDLTVSSILKENNQWVNTGKAILGIVPGVEVGDEFHFRVEISIVGLHRPFQGGIDAVKVKGTLLATSIVASGGADDMDNSDVLIYSGAGGAPCKGKEASDQKLERGNLALKNSIDENSPVRVIRGFKETSHDSARKLVTTLIYDGLYKVEKYWTERGALGFNVFKFQLRRMPGQPELPFREVKKSKKSRIREGLCIADISQGLEKFPICAVNTIDDDKPLPYKYTTKIIYPSWYSQSFPAGCACIGGCSDSEICACAVKNGGEIPFNFNRAIVQAKPLIYECGPFCKCPPSCHNRVSQHGINIPLEIFKTESRGWGVRSLCSIPSGTFICEYIGELLKDSEAEKRSNDEYLFDIGHNYDDHSMWEGLSNNIPALQVSSPDEATEDVGFTIDAAEYGNVGRFINHSCSPNLYAQNVLYDHDDKRIPHIMFFAADNIPPLQEVTYDYNYKVDQVQDSEGNIKRKPCHCGSLECTGRLY